MPRRSKSQLNAISYSYTAKEHERLQKILILHGLTAEFKRSKYKTVRGFLKHKGLI
jgi:hypothetical protein